MNIEDIDIDIIINKRFVKPINRKYNKLIKNINNDSFRHSESLGLIKQIDLSLKNIKYNIDRGNLVDANSLLRAIVEYISMATMIQYDEETYLEFINLSLKNSKRKKTNPKKLIENFSNKLNDILSELYNLENDDEIPQIYEFYEYLCRYTHSSLCVSSMIKIETKDEKDFMKIAMIQNYYLVKMIVYYVLAYIEHDNNVIKVEYISFVSILYLYKIAKFIQVTNIKFDYIKDIMYESINKEFFNTSKNSVLELKKEIEDILKIMIENEQIGNSFLKFICIK